MGKVATCELIAPAPKPQPVGHVGRLVTITGSHADGSTTVDVQSPQTITVRSDFNASVTISIREVLSNGKKSPEVAPFVFTPSDHVEGVAADHSQFAVRVVSVEDAPDPTASSATTDPIPSAPTPGGSAPSDTPTTSANSDASAPSTPSASPGAPDPKA